MKENQSPAFVHRDGMIADKEYVAWLSDLKQRFQRSQIKAAVRVNSAMLEFYWSLGRDIVQKQAESKWGSSFFDNLSQDMRMMFPKETGFSSANLRYMKRWYSFYNEQTTILQRPVEEIAQRPVEELYMPDSFGNIPWGQHIEIFTKCKTLDEALFYIRKTIENSWSRPILEDQIKAGLYQAQGAAITNFNETLPEAQTELAKEMLKDPYNFEFLTMKARYDEKDLEEALVANITQFLLELGKGFSYVGRQMELQMPGGQTFFPDLVFQKPLGVATYQLQEVVERTVAEIENRKETKELLS